MNPYPFLKKQFWIMRQEFRFSSTQADLYCALLHISNELYWKNPFGITNMALCAMIGCSENTMTASRNILKQRGLIEFKSNNKKNEATTYVICHLELYLKNLGTNDSTNTNNDENSNLYLKNLGTNKGTNKGTNRSTNKGTNLEKPEDIIIHKTNTNTNTNLEVEEEKNFFEKNFNPPPTEKNKELEELEFLRKKILELENQKTALNSEEQPKKEKKVATKKEKSKEILFSQSDVAEFSEFEKRFLDSDYKLFDLRFYYEAVKNWSESKEAKKINWVATARGFMLRDVQDGKAKMKNAEIVQQQNKKNYQNGSNNTYEQRQNERIARIQSSVQNITGSSAE